MFNRILLLAAIVGLWVLMQLLDAYMPVPVLLFLLCMIIAGMSLHTVWLLSAQSRWSRKQKKLLAAKIDGHEVQANSIDGSLVCLEPVWKPSVDIFVSAKNEARVIENCVRNLFKIDWDDYQVWIIDDNSSDNTAQIIEGMQAEFPRLRLIKRTPDSRPGKSAALNEALALAKGEAVAVFDADSYVAPDFLKIMLPVLAPEDVGAVQAQKKIYESQTGFLVECQASEYAIDTYFQMSRDLIKGVVELRGNGQIVKRQALIDVGGWNNNSITDDLDLSMRLLVNNWSISFCPDAVVWEEAVPTLKGLIRQRRRWAEGSIRRYLDYAFPLNSPFRLSFVERFDILVFLGQFAVPLLVALEVMSELMAFLTGGQTHSRLFLGVLIGIGLVTQVNFFNGLRYYRKNGNVLQAWLHSGVINTYMFALWMPCVFIGIKQIIFHSQTSTWHRTEHSGQPHLPTVS